MGQEQTTCFGQDGDANRIKHHFETNPKASVREARLNLKLKKNVEIQTIQINPHVQFWDYGMYGKTKFESFLQYISRILC